MNISRIKKSYFNTVWIPLISHQSRDGGHSVTLFYRWGTTNTVLVELRFKTSIWLQSTLTQEVKGKGLERRGSQWVRWCLQRARWDKSWKQLLHLAIRKCWRTLKSEVRNQVTGNQGGSQRLQVEKMVHAFLLNLFAKNSNKNTYIFIYA